MSGAGVLPDRRLNAYRDDLADIRLKGRVEAARFVEGRRERILVSSAPLRREPRPDAALETEALFGEDVLVFETDDDGWCWVQLAGDSYVGWMPATALGADASPPTHRVSVPRTFVFPGPDIKLPPLFALPMGSLVTARGEAEDRNASYVLTAPSGAVVSRHLVPIGRNEPDFVSVAERFLGVPYLWGGRTQAGIDCSGLLQIALGMAGMEAPRDTDMQERVLGTRLAGVEALRRGDLVFWKGHVGMMLDGRQLLHANAFHMMTATEPLADAVARAETRGSSITSIRRLS